MPDARTPNTAPHAKIMKMLIAADGGAWITRIDAAEQACALSAGGDFKGAIASLEEARQAVAGAEAYDSPVLKIGASIRAARESAETQRIRQGRAEQQEQQAAVRRSNEDAREEMSRAKRLPPSKSVSPSRSDVAAPAAHSLRQHRKSEETSDRALMQSEPSRLDSGVDSAGSYSRKRPMGVTEATARQQGSLRTTATVATAGALEAATERLESGDLQGALAQLEDVLVTAGGNDGLGLKLVLRKAAAKLLTDCDAAKSEADAAKTYAQGRDSEVYNLSVAKKRVEDEVKSTDDPR